MGLNRAEEHGLIAETDKHGDPNEEGHEVNSAVAALMEDFDGESDGPMHDGWLHQPIEEDSLTPRLPPPFSVTPAKPTTGGDGDNLADPSPGRKSVRRASVMDRTNLTAGPAPMHKQDTNPRSPTVTVTDGVVSFQRPPSLPRRSPQNESSTTAISATKSQLPSAITAATKSQLPSATACKHADAAAVTYNKPPTQTKPQTLSQPVATTPIQTPSIATATQVTTPEAPPTTMASPVAGQPRSSVLARYPPAAGTATGSAQKKPTPGPPPPKKNLW